MSLREPPNEPDDIEVEEFDDDTEEFLEAWDKADREAAGQLCSALERYRGEPELSDLAAAAARFRERLGEGGHLDWIRKAAGLEQESLPDSDVELLLRCAAATISPQEETGLDLEEEAILMSLEHADWLGAVVSIVRGGPGADASPHALVEGIRECPEIELDGEFDLDDARHIETVFWIVALPWHVLGLTDRDHRLTEVGAWVLPRALARAWNADIDAGPEG